MKTVMTVMAVMALTASLARAEFSKPTSEQIAAAAAEPATIQALLTNATPAQASAVLLAVVYKVQKLGIPIDEQQERVAALFTAVFEAMGDGAALVINDVARRVNPELLPRVTAPGATVVATPGLPTALPLAPPIAPKYTGQ